MLLPQVLGVPSEIEFPDRAIPADVHGVDRNGCTTTPAYQRLKQHRHPKRSKTEMRLMRRECRADPRPVDTPSGVVCRHQPSSTESTSSSSVSNFAALTAASSMA